MRLWLLTALLCSQIVPADTTEGERLLPGQGIAFGSCLSAGAPQPVWNSILAQKPSAFIFAGDTVYADKGRYAEMSGTQGIYAAYQDLTNNHEFMRFRYRANRQSVDVLATWDDHDYGLNDAGAEFPHKLASKDAFLYFFEWDGTETGDASQPGIYQSHVLEVTTATNTPVSVQVILLDTRSFRSPLLKATAAQQRPGCKANHAIANHDPQVTVLGDQQWQWLATTLQEPADVRLLVSSIQVLPIEHCYEKWANFPTERARLLNLIQETAANGVVILSGDRHLAEISKLPAAGLEASLDYPLYEITSSGLNSAIGHGHAMTNEYNRLRTSTASFGSNNFGYIAIEDHADTGLTLVLSLLDEHGSMLQRLPVPLSQLSVGSALPEAVSEATY